MTRPNNDVVVTRMGNLDFWGRKAGLGVMISGFMVAGVSSVQATDAALGAAAVPVSMPADTAARLPLAALPAPTGEVILTISGAISLTNGATDAGPAASLDLGLIESIGLTTFTTGTVWTDGPRTFEGIDLAHLLTALGAQGSSLRLTALNDYAVEFPITEAVPGGPMLALRMEGKDLSPRDKGPLWMVYPFDLKEEYKNEVSYSRSIWQLARIEVLP